MTTNKEQNALSKIKAFLEAGHSLDAIREAGWANWIAHLEGEGYDLRTGQLALVSPEEQAPQNPIPRTPQSRTEYELPSDFDIGLLEDEIVRRSRRGWQLTSQTATSAQMRKPTRFSLFAALLWTLFFGIGLIIYIFWHISKREETVYLRLTDGSLEIHDSNMLSTVLQPFQAWLRWAGEREETYQKILAYGLPVAGTLAVVSLAAQSMTMSILSGAAILVIAFVAAGLYWFDHR